MSSLSRFIDKLVEDKSVPAVRVPRAVQDFIQPLMDAGIIELQKYGRGARFRLVDADSLKNYLKKNKLEDLDPAKDGHTRQQVNKKRKASDAKRSLAQGAATATMRFFSGGLTYPDVAVDVKQMTQQLGVVSAQIYSDTPLRIDCKRIAVVENLELFYYVEHIHEALDCALYAGSHIHEALLAWLCKHNDIEVVYFGPYSPLGAKEYIRLRDRLDARVSFYIPDNLETLFKKFNNKALLKNNVSEYHKLKSEQDPSVVKLVDLMKRHGGGVGQEALLVDDG